MFQRPSEDALEHLAGEPPRIRILPGAVVAREKHSSIRRQSFGAMSELRRCRT